MKNLDEIAFDGDMVEAGHAFGVTLIQIAEMHTDSRLDEAHCFLQARTLAQNALRAFQVEFTDSTFGGKATP